LTAGGKPDGRLVRGAHIHSGVMPCMTDILQQLFSRALHGKTGSKTRIKEGFMQLTVSEDQPKEETETKEMIPVVKSGHETSKYNSAPRPFLRIRNYHEKAGTYAISGLRKEPCKDRQE
jgi:hypothetical protein